MFAGVCRVNRGLVSSKENVYFPIHLMSWNMEWADHSNQHDQEQKETLRLGQTCIRGSSIFIKARHPDFSFLDSLIRGNTGTRKEEKRIFSCDVTGAVISGRLKAWRSSVINIELFMLHMLSVYCIFFSWTKRSKKREDYGGKNIEIPTDFLLQGRENYFKDLPKKIIRVTSIKQICHFVKRLGTIKMVN